MSKIYLKEPQRNRNATANFVNLIRTSTVPKVHETRTGDVTIHYHAGFAQTLYFVTQRLIRKQNVCLHI